MNTDDQAKKLYWEYDCNRFGLDHDGVTPEYLRLGGGDKAKETQWRREFIDYWVARVSAEDHMPLFRLQGAEAVEAIPSLFAMEDYGDDFVKFWFAFAFQDLSGSKRMGGNEKAAARAKAKALWEAI